MGPAVKSQIDGGKNSQGDGAAQRVGDPVVEVGGSQRNEQLMPFIACAVRARAHEGQGYRREAPAPFPDERAAQQQGERAIFECMERLVPYVSRELGQRSLGRE